MAVGFEFFNGLIIMKCPKFKGMWKRCLENPKKLVRICVLFACSIVVIFQLYECFNKLFHPPITTHTYFDLNNTLEFPAVTICRDPPYKEDVLKKYNLKFHPRYENAFRDFPFDVMNLTELWRQATYSYGEMIKRAGLNGSEDSVKIYSSMHFEFGQCHTLSPVITMSDAWKKSGYSVLLLHDLFEDDDSPEDTPPGWHVFIHEEKEPFTENLMQTSGRVEYIYLGINEELDLKMQVQQLELMPSNDNDCTNDEGYSSIKCSEQCHWERVTGAAGCTGPWMPTVKAKECDDGESTITLIKQFSNSKPSPEDRDCGCVSPCKSTIFNAYVLNRKKIAEKGVKFSQLYVYYSSKMVSVIEERPGYDLSQFVSDMGGSLGFLLGLSVLGLIGLFEQVAILLLTRCLPSERTMTVNSENKKEENYNTREKF